MDARRRRQPALTLVVAALAACGGESKRVAPVPAPHAVLAFIDDDYPRALAEARAKRRPIFVDAWAPWCHSCQSMRNFVLNDPLLAPIADDFVWLSIDTERAQNAAFVAKFTHEALPTLWVIRPDDEAVVKKWAGTLTAKELRDLLSEEAPSEVRVAHDQVMDAARKDAAGCASLALAEAKRLPRGTPRADILAVGLSCARDAEQQAESDALLEIALGDATEPSATGERREGALLADDRSALFEQIVETKKARGDEAGAKATAALWARLLEGEAAKAKTPAARAVFDAHRLGAYLALGEPARAVAMLEQSERDFPDDYNAPARLATTYLAMGQLDDAAAAALRARKRVYGPRVLRVLAVAADIAKARGDRASEKALLEEALSRTADAVLTPGQAKVRAALATRLASLPP